MPFDASTRPRGNPLNQLPQGRFELDRSHPLTVGLVGFWPLNGDATDYSALGNYGTRLGGVQPAVDQFGPCLSFNGSTTYVDLGVPAALQPAKLTVAAWIRPTTTGNSQTAIGYDKTSGGQAYNLSIGALNAGRVEFIAYNGGWFTADAASSLLTAGKWAFLVGTYDGTSLRFYLNGVLQATTALGALDYTGASKLNIGNYWNAGPGVNWFGGNVNLVSIYNRALSAAEIMRLYVEPCALLVPVRRRMPPGLPYSGPPFGDLNITQQDQTLSAAGTVATPLAPIIGMLGGVSPPVPPTVLLMHADGTAGSTTFTDSSFNAHTLTATSTTVIATSKFGSGAADFTASSTSRIDTGNATDFQFGAGPFTVEAWIYATSDTSVHDTTILSQWYGDLHTGNGGWTLRLDGFLRFFYSTDGTLATIVGTGAVYTPPLNTWVHIAVDRDVTNTLRVYVNGVVRNAVSVADTIYPSTLPCLIGNNQSDTTNFPGYLDDVRITKGLAQYGGAFTPPAQAFLPGYTIGLNQADQTLSAAGTVGAGAAITGTLNVTQAAHIIAAAGSVPNPAALALVEQPDTLAATAGLIVRGSLALIEQSDTLTATGASTITGTLLRTQANHTLVATAGPVVTGTLALTEQSDTLAGTGTLGAVVGTLVLTEQPDTLAAVGALSITGALALTEQPDTLAATGASAITATLVRTQAPNTVVTTGVITVGGTLAVTEHSDTLVAAGNVVGGVTGSLGITQADQMLSASGGPVLVGTLNQTQANQLLVARAGLAVGGTLARTQADQTLAATADVTVRGFLNATQVNHALAAAGVTGPFVAPAFIPSSEIVYPPTFKSNAAFVLPEILSTATLPSPTFLPGPVTLVSGFIPSSEILFAPVVHTVGVLHPAFIPSSEIVYSPTLIVEGFLHPGVIPSAETAFRPTLIAGVAGLPVDFILNTDALFAPTMGTALLTHPPPGVYSAAFDVPPAGRVR